MRLFVGVWLPLIMRDEVLEFIKQIRATASGWKWTSQENLHFTLKFLGEVNPERLPVLEGALAAAAAGCAEFGLKLGRPGVFPALGNPRVLWLGTAQGQAQLGTLATAVETACVDRGFEPADKPFKPHLTIARAKGDSAVFQPQNDVRFSEETLIQGFSLIESRLLPKGPVYQAVRDFQLGPGR